MKKPLAAVLVTAAAVATLTVPAGAAQSKDWKVQTLPCATGYKSAVFAYSPTHPYWVPSPDDDGSGVINPKGWRPWFSNPCKGQWLVFSVWEGDPSPDSTLTISSQTGTSGRVTPGNGTMTGLMVAHLADAPTCDVGGADREIIAKAGTSYDGITPYCTD